MGAKGAVWLALHFSDPSTLVRVDSLVARLIPIVCYFDIGLAIYFILKQWKYIMKCHVSSGFRKNYIKYVSITFNCWCCLGTTRLALGTRNRNLVRFLSTALLPAGDWLCVHLVSLSLPPSSLDQGWATMMMERATIFSHSLQGATMLIKSKISKK